MIIIPAIDIKNGKCVRLTQGKFDRETTYNDDPISVAQNWEKEGAKILHIVDLDGAQKSNLTNIETIKQIRRTVKIPVQVGGGINNEKTAIDLIAIGIDRIILSTIAIENKELLRQLLGKFAPKIVVSLDAKNGKLMKKGWQEKTQINAIEEAIILEKIGVQRFIYTDVTKDGTLTKPNFNEIHALLKKVSVPVIAAGGITTLEDLKKLQALGIEGAIIGKALYEGRVDFQELTNKFKMF